MASIPGFWDVGPHDPIPVEEAWRDFVSSIGGTLVDEILPEPRTFENADFYFAAASVVAELKVVETEFARSPRFHEDFDRLMRRLMAEEPTWRPALLGGEGRYPNWFHEEFIRLFRPPIGRILKKANRQLRQTKDHFSIQRPTGVVLFANDGFTSLGPEPIRALASNLLLHSYSSVDCLVYLTVNRYIAFPKSETPRLLWAPTYSDRAQDDLVEFVDSLGRRWFDYLEARVGPFTDRIEAPQPNEILRGTHAIVLPNNDA